MSAANPQGGGQGARRNLSGRAIILRLPICGWPFEFIGFLIARYDVNGLTQFSEVRNIDKLTVSGCSAAW